MSASREPPLHWNVERENLLVPKSILQHSEFFFFFKFLHLVAKISLSFQNGAPWELNLFLQTDKNLVVWHLFVQSHSDTGWFCYQFPLTICGQFVHNLFTICAKLFHNLPLIFVHSFAQHIVHNFVQHIVHTLFQHNMGAATRGREGICPEII